MTRWLGIDHGLKRIGLAVADDSTHIATPVTTIQVGRDVEAQVRAIHLVAVEYGVDAFVVGLPLNMDDSEGPQAKLVRAFGDELSKITGMDVCYWDERLSSLAAEELLIPAELTHGKKKDKIDRVAAQILLQGFLDDRNPRSAG